MADLVECHEVGHLISEGRMLNPAFLHPSPTTASLNRASDAVLSAQSTDVLPSGHAVTLTD